MNVGRGVHGNLGKGAFRQRPRVALIAPKTAGVQCIEAQQRAQEQNEEEWNVLAHREYEEYHLNNMILTAQLRAMLVMRPVRFSKPDGFDAIDSVYLGKWYYLNEVAYALKLS